jgi:riboflavin kinase/FMN adenylyltransferase
VPTANIALKRRVSPVSGVFVVTVLGLLDKIYQGVANIGTRPTVNGTRQQLEVNIFNFNQDIYGQQVEVILEKKLRNEVRFDDFNALKQQISKDIKQAKEWHEKNNSDTSQRFVSVGR